MCYIEDMGRNHRVYSTHEVPALRDGALMKGDLMELEPPVADTSDDDVSVSDATTVPNEEDSCHSISDNDSPSHSQTTLLQIEMDVEFTERLPWGDIPLDYKLQDVFAEIPNFLVEDDDGVSFMQSRSRDDALPHPPDDEEADHQDDPTPDDGLLEDHEGHDDSPPVSNHSVSDHDDRDGLAGWTAGHRRWQVVYTDMPFEPPLLQAGAQGPDAAQVGALLNVPVAEIVALHLVPHMRETHGANVVIAEHHADHVHPGSEVLVFFEVICYDQDSSATDDSDAHHFYSVHVSRTSHSFDTFVQIMRLARIAYQFPQFVRLYLNGQRWHMDDRTRYSLANGDHIAVAMEAPETTEYRADLIDWVLGQGLSLWPSLLRSSNISISPTLPFVAETPDAPPLCEAPSQELPEQAQIAILLSTVVMGGGPEPRQEAFSAADRLERRHYLQMMEVEHLCARRIFTCSVTQDGRELVDSEIIRRPTGQAITVWINELETPATSTAAADFTSLMQQMHTYINPNASPEIAEGSGSTPHSVEVHEPVTALTPSTGAPLACDVQPTDERAFVNLRTLFQVRSHWEPELFDRAAYVATYFLSPVRMPMCAFARWVRITSSEDTWRLELLRAWAPLIDLNAPAEVFIVMPPPHQREGPGHQTTAYALVVQDRGELDCPYLATIEEDGFFIHIAKISPNPLTQRGILCSLGFGPRCYASIHASGHLMDDQPYHLPLGAGILVSLRPVAEHERDLQAERLQHIRSIAPPDDPIHTVDPDGQVSFLQIAATRLASTDVNSLLDGTAAFHEHGDGFNCVPGCCSSKSFSCDKGTQEPYTEDNSDLCSLAGTGNQMGCAGGSSVVLPTAHPWTQIPDSLRLDHVLNDWSQAPTWAPSEMPPPAASEQPPISISMHAADERLHTLNTMFRDLCHSEWIGLNTDFTALPCLHPAAAFALASTPQVACLLGICCTWCLWLRDGEVFLQAGVCCSALDSDLTDYKATSLDAESTALIAVAEFLLANPWMRGSKIICHFDAQAAGFGAFGLQAPPITASGPHDRSHAARLLISLAQQVYHMEPRHVHAHEGCPWNEFVDSLAAGVVHGWQPTIPCTLRSRTFLAHPLRSWAWMQLRPNAVIPSLETVLANQKPTAKPIELDPHLAPRPLPSQPQTQILHEVNEQLGDVGYLDHPLLHDLTVPHNVTYVDDLALAIYGSTTQLLDRVTHVASVLVDITTEHGLQLNFSPGKTSVLLSFRGAGSEAARLKHSVTWLIEQTGVEGVPDELQDLSQFSQWQLLGPYVRSLRKRIRRAELAHLQRVHLLVSLERHAQFQAEVFQDMGWTPPPIEAPLPNDHACTVCGATFASLAALAVHMSKRHGQRIAVRRFAPDATCRICARHFHTRPRLVQHLQSSSTNCWIPLMRHFCPQAVEMAAALDEQDRDQQVAAHQRGLLRPVRAKVWRDATPAEMQPVLCPRDAFETFDHSDPSAEEIVAWSAYGMLPPGRGGRPTTKRGHQQATVANVVAELRLFETTQKAQAHAWTAAYDWVPRPFSQGQKYVLIIFSGHRRYADLGCWLAWTSDLQPICIDLAVDAQHGDAMNDHLWIQLIQARRVVAAHAGPPCETFSMARWIEQPHLDNAPRPLRDAGDPWGKTHRRLAEVMQCCTGGLLFIQALKLLLLTWMHGGAVSLEHPRGPLDCQVAWPPGPMLGETDHLPLGAATRNDSRIYQAFEPRWRPSLQLGGLDAQGAWRTMRAKAYPPRLREVMAAEIVNHYDHISEEGFDPMPAASESMLAALAFWDPYLAESCATTMASDYHRSHGRP
eukprot:Skav228716  [mRNA]  locus=scaffold1830:70352:79014:- [translate_table: standard]